MRNFFKWVLATALYCIGWFSLAYFYNLKDPLLSIIFFILAIVFLGIPAFEYWGSYIDKVFDNKEKTEE